MLDEIISKFKDSEPVMTVYTTVPAPQTLKEFFVKEYKFDKGFIAGGALRDYFIYTTSKARLDEQNNKPHDWFNMITDFGDKDLYIKDIDVFFESKEDFDEVLKKSKKSGSNVVYSSRNSVGLANSNQMSLLDFVCRDFGSIEETLDRFDFTVAQCAFYRDTDGEYKLMFSEGFLKDVFYSNLRLTNSYTSGEYHSSNSMFERLLRYCTYGFMPDEKTIRNIFDLAAKHTPEIKELLDNPVWKKRFISNKGVASLKGVEWLRSKVEYDKKGSGSFSNSYYNIERKCIRTIVQGVKEPKFDGSDYVLDFIERYSIPYVLRDPGLMTVELLKFLDSKRDVLGVENIRQLTMFIFAYDFTIVEKRSIRCNICSAPLKYCSYVKAMVENGKVQFEETHKYPNRKVKVELYYNENSAEILYKAFRQKDSDEWAVKVAEFFVEYFTSFVENSMNMKSWIESLNGDVFDPEIPAPLLILLLSSSDEERVYN